ncbi:MAG TPA: methionyl-tRNA formyltransferase [Pyrinomonadaceae bacterium]|nr:methionyl-tRNA formyltransferase [Pyrinomonadaceae bacterium]
MRLVFMGTPETAVPTLKRCVEDGHEVVAVWTQPDRPAGRGGRLHASPVKEYALSKGLAVRQPPKLKTEEALALFESHGADAAVVVAYGRILPATYLRAPRVGCINVHFSLLPKYRGAAPVNWAVVRGEQETGVTTMLMDEGLDTGPLLLQRATPIGERETAPELLARLSHTGAELLSETLARLGELEPRPQRAEDATHAPMLRREDGLIDWTHDASEIERRVRGFQPWPNAHTTHGGRRLILWSAEPFNINDDQERAPVEPSPGTVVEARGDELAVACGKGTALRVSELQPEGKQRMKARDFINGMRVEAGARFGD